jgi:hypothetical protein
VPVQTVDATLSKNSNAIENKGQVTSKSFFTDCLWVIRRRIVRERMSAPLVTSLCSYAAFFSK